MTELYDLQNKGAIAFGDYLRPIDNPELLKIGLQYAQQFNALILSSLARNCIGGHGVAHEGTGEYTVGTGWNTIIKRNPSNHKRLTFIVLHRWEITYTPVSRLQQV